MAYWSLYDINRHGSIPTSIGSGFRVIVTAPISNSRVIPFRNGTIARKKQDATLYLVADGDGSFSTTGTECQSTTFELSLDGRLLQDTSRIFASAAGIIAGSGHFQSISIGSTTAGQDDVFSVVGTNVQWSNPEFGNANAIFALDPVSNSVQVCYSGSPPIDTVIQLSILASDNCVSSSQSGNTGPSSVGISSEIDLATLPASQSRQTFGSGGDLATQTNSNLAPFTNPAFAVTSTYTSTYDSTINGVWNTPVPGSPCYVCEMMEEGIAPPGNIQFTIISKQCTACANGVLPTPDPVVYKGCATCSPTPLLNIPIIAAGNASTKAPRIDMMPAMTGYAMPVATPLTSMGVPHLVVVPLPITVTVGLNITAASTRRPVISTPAVNTPAISTPTVFQGSASKLIGFSGIFGLMIGILLFSI
ncbi:hypothetical protein IFR04_007172 [Cadophora malorum]|uniref:Uncharacterized protein n=1 Tax=Cadophora malorum TaxID=108018 RepID=A0A8H7TI72_9HELO|nr:hypothetical protein IFR04_007172 [Cadophora malorum]